MKARSSRAGAAGNVFPALARIFPTSKERFRILSLTRFVDYAIKTLGGRASCISRNMYNAILIIYFPARSGNGVLSHYADLLSLIFAYFDSDRSAIRIENCPVYGYGENIKDLSVQINICAYKYYICI